MLVDLHASFALKKLCFLLVFRRILDPLLPGSCSGLPYPGGTLHEPLPRHSLATRGIPSGQAHFGGEESGSAQYNEGWEAKQYFIES